MASKNGKAAADEARGAPEFDLLASGINRENKSASTLAQATPIVVTIRGPAVAKGIDSRDRESPTPGEDPEI